MVRDLIPYPSDELNGDFLEMDLPHLARHGLATLTSITRSAGAQAHIYQLGISSI